MAQQLFCYLLCAFCIQNSLQTQTVWKPVIVSNSTLQNTTLITEQANASVDVACSIIATRQPWAKLFCIVGEHCIISSFLAVPYPSQVPIADPVECMTNIDGCLYDGLTLIKLGDHYCPPLGDLNAPYLCVEGVLIPVAHQPPKEKCPSTFKVNKYGCLLSKLAMRISFCLARLTCLEMESDLYIFDQKSSPVNIKGFMDATTGNNILHAGFTGNATNFKWLNGKDLLRDSKLWHTNIQPWGTGDPLCGLIHSDDNYKSYGLANRPCSSSNFPYVCQIKIFK